MVKGHINSTLCLETVYHRSGAIRRTIIHSDNLELQRHRTDSVDHVLDGTLLVIGGDDDG
jgi:hypothetical protein